jgi:CBS domain-containing protein
LVTLGNNPSVLLKDIKRAKKNKNLRSARLKANTLLKSYLEQNIPLSHIVKIISKINDAVTERAIQLSIKKMGTPPPVAFSWIAIGSQGRKEQLLFTDQDTALIFDDVPEKDYEKVQVYFLELAKLVTKSLNIIGFEYCKADMMASNAEWCQSITEWKNQFNEWIVNADEKGILLSSIFFDYSLQYGEQSLVDDLTHSIYKTLENSSVFFKYLAKDALKSPPPLGFFKQFLVEQNGEHKDLFNIKSISKSK